MLFSQIGSLLTKTKTFRVLKSNSDSIGGVFILYPMFHKSRRNERDPKIIEDLKKKYKYFIDLREFEAEDKALEGKGSLVFDYRNKKIFCSK